MFLQLINDKKALSELCEGVVGELKQVDQKYTKKISQMQEQHEMVSPRLPCVKSCMLLITSCALHPALWPRCVCLTVLSLFLPLFFCFTLLLCLVSPPVFSCPLGVANSGSVVRGNFFSCLTVVFDTIICLIFCWTVCLHVSLFSFI